MFEWIRQTDKQRTYDYDLSLVSTAPTPQNIKYAGMEWIRDIDQQLTYFNNSIFISLEDISFSTTNSWEDKSYINFKSKITHTQNKSVKYKIIVGEEEIITSNVLSSTPINLDINVPMFDFKIGENEVMLLITDEDDIDIDYNFIITKENRDTFTFKRTFDFKEDYIKDSNIEAIYGEGLALKDIRAGSFELNIPTEGKSKIRNIEVAGYGNQNKIPIIPTLTSNSQDGYEVSASSIRGIDYDAWRMFDNKKGSKDCWISKVSSPLPQWIQIKTPNKININKYSITVRNEAQYFNPPKSWRFEGSIDGFGWSILDIQKRVPKWDFNETREYKIQQKIDHYMFYRIVITEKYGSDCQIEIGELQLYSTDLDTIEKIIIDKPMTYIKDLGVGKVYESRLLTEYSDITNIGIIQGGGIDGIRKTRSC